MEKLYYTQHINKWKILSYQTLILGKIIIGSIKTYLQKNIIFKINMVDGIQEILEKNDQKQTATSCHILLLYRVDVKN